MWWNRSKRQILILVLLAAVLAGAFWLGGGAPGSRGWTVEGSFLEWDYSVYDGQRQVAQISKELLRWTDTYVLDIADPADALYVLMLVLAIDAEKCSRNS